MKIGNILLNIHGEPEVGRVLLAVAGTSSIFAPIAFEWWDMAHNNAHFDVTAWCVAYPGGLGALVGMGVFSIGKKEKDLASARSQGTDG